MIIKIKENERAANEKWKKSFPIAFKIFFPILFGAIFGEIVNRHYNDSFFVDSLFFGLALFLILLVFARVWKGKKIIIFTEFFLTLFISTGVAASVLTVMNSIAMNVFLFEYGIIWLGYFAMTIAFLRLKVGSINTETK